MKRFKTLKSYTLYTLLCVCIFTVIYYIIASIEIEFNILNWQIDLLFLSFILTTFISYCFCGCLFLARNN